MNICHICGKEVTSDTPKLDVFYEITGIEEPRRGGGANMIHERKRTGRRFHRVCVLGLKENVADKLYREAMGDEAADRQIEARRRELGQCVCPGGKGHTVKVRGVFRTLHIEGCPKRKPYMAEVERDIAEREQATRAYVTGS
jgi:hypothetical protein